MLIRRPSKICFLCSSGIAVHHVLLVLWITSCFHMLGRSSSVVCTCMLSCVWKPAKEDVSGWCALCFGRLHVSRSIQKIRGCNETDELTCSDSDVSDGNAGHHMSSRGGTPPLLSIVTRMDQVSSM